MRTFWMVWRESGGYPWKQHESRVRAEHEAERLARAHPGQRFHVLQALGSVMKSDLVWDRPEPKLKSLDYTLTPEEIPF